MATQEAAWGAYHPDRAASRETLQLLPCKFYNAVPSTQTTIDEFFSTIMLLPP